MNLFSIARINYLCVCFPGDIAILLHAGMSIKRALLYNLLAALTCFAGLACGIILGETIDASLWIFAIAGGMFFYVALVDMVSLLLT